MTQPGHASERRPPSASTTYTQSPAAPPPASLLDSGFFPTLQPRYGGRLSWLVQHWTKWAEPPAPEAARLLTTDERYALLRGQVLARVQGAMLLFVTISAPIVAISSHDAETTILPLVMLLVLLVAARLNHAGHCNWSSLLTAGFLNLGLIFVSGTGWGLTWIVTPGYDLLAIGILLATLTFGPKFGWSLAGFSFLALAALIALLPEAPDLYATAAYFNIVPATGSALDLREQIAPVLLFRPAILFAGTALISSIFYGQGVRLYAALDRANTEAVQSAHDLAQQRKFDDLVLDLLKRLSNDQPLPDQLPPEFSEPVQQMYLRVVHQARKRYRDSRGAMQAWSAAKNHWENLLEVRLAARRRGIMASGVPWNAGRTGSKPTITGFEPADDALEALGAAEVAYDSAEIEAAIDAIRHATTTWFADPSDEAAVIPEDQFKGTRLAVVMDLINGVLTNADRRTDLPIPVELAAEDPPHAPTS